ncbi:hypothetical protein [Flavobacterium sp. N2820]|uniref:hypothetical protein n=1 Tax=Flavobacterium sp. N2820 TaxID=2986834 RepID=UPI00222556F0|nr:hypothetical protein [Flavobacterium sp. N2820]
MAKQKSFLKVAGTLDGLTFYKSVDGHLVRTKGGVSKSRIMNDPAYIRTRENIAEFGNTAQSGKLLRNAIGTMLNRAKDPRMSSRMMGVLSKVRQLDASSSRGERVVSEGISTSSGKQLLKGFDFNNRAALQAVFHAPFNLDTATGVITIADFVPLDQLQIPEGASHVSFRSAFINLDFTNGTFDTQYSPIVNRVLDMNSTTITLTPVAIPSGSGTQLHLLLIEFFQEVNGLQYPLRNGAFNVLNLIDIV